MVPQSAAKSRKRALALEAKQEREEERKRKKEEREKKKEEREKKKEEREKKKEEERKRKKDGKEKAKEEREKKKEEEKKMREEERKKRSEEEAIALLRRPPPIPLDTTTLRSMDTVQLIDYSFSSVQAAEAVSKARIEVALMDIYLYGFKNYQGDHPDPEDVQGIELTFADRSRRKILWWFTGDDGGRMKVNSVTGRLHKKTTVDGVVLHKSFHTSLGPTTTIGCISPPSRFVHQLIAVENHFRSVFVVHKTNIDVNGQLIKKYKKYLEQPKTVNKMRVNSKIVRGYEAKMVFSAIRPKVLSYEATFPWDPTEMTAEEIYVECGSEEVPFGALLKMNASEIHVKSQAFTSVSTATVRRLVDFWLMGSTELKWAESLKLMVIESQKPFDHEHLFAGLPTSGYEPSRRDSHWRKKVDGRLVFKVDLRQGADVVRASDGKLATLYLEPTEKSVVYLAVWHDRFPHGHVV